MKVFSNWPSMSFWTCSKPSRFLSLLRLANSPPRISSQFGPQTISVHLLAGDQAARARGRRRLHFGCRLQVLVVEGERLVVVVDLGQVRVGEDAHQQLPLRALARLDPAVGLAHPAAVPLVLVLPLLRIADAGLGLDVVEPGVFHARPAGPDVLAGDRTGVAADALVEVQHHADLGADLHAVSCRAVPEETAPRVTKGPVQVPGGSERM